MSIWFRVLFLFSSFGPLYFLVAASLYVQRQWLGSVVATSLFMGSFVIFLYLRTGFRRKSVTRSQVKLQESLDENILTYLVAYIPPLLIDDLSEPRKVVPVIVFYVITAVLMFKVSTLYINPYFVIFGYRIYRVQLESGRPVILIASGREVVAGDTLNLYEVEPSRLYFAT